MTVGVYQLQAYRFETCDRCGNRAPETAVRHESDTEWRLLCGDCVELFDFYCRGNVVFTSIERAREENYR
jgi:hypothetical protein